MPNDLKPCPFCGYRLTLSEGVCPGPDKVDDETGEWTFTGICCPSCAVFLPKATETASVEDGVEEWNRCNPSDTNAALRLVVAYDDLLKKHQGDEDTILFDGDIVEVDDAYDKMIAAAKSALSQSNPSPLPVDDGWQLVPKKPTEHMLACGACHEDPDSLYKNNPLWDEGDLSLEVYGAMLSVAPKPPVMYPVGTVAQKSADVLKAADDAIVSSVKAIFIDGEFHHDELLDHVTVRERVRKAILAAAPQPAAQEPVRDFASDAERHKKALNAAVEAVALNSFDTDDAETAIRAYLSAMGTAGTVAQEPVGTQHRIRVKEQTASWSDWRDGAANLSDKVREYIDVEERAIYAAPPPAAQEPVGWRWKFDKTGNWHFGVNKPSNFRFGNPDEIEPLYASPPREEGRYNAS